MAGRSPAHAFFAAPVETIPWTIPAASLATACRACIRSNTLTYLIDYELMRRINARKERAELIGTDQWITSGPAATPAALRGRIHGCTRIVSRKVRFFSLARRAPSIHGKYCCKTLFALLIKNSPGYRRDFRVKMWGTSCPDDKLVSDLAKAAEAMSLSLRLYS